MFTVIDNLTGRKADLQKVAQEDWAKMDSVEDFALKTGGALMLMDNTMNGIYCPEGRFDVRWHGMVHGAIEDPQGP